MASIEMKTARSHAVDADKAAEELLTGLGAMVPKLAFLFASRSRDQRALNAALRKRLPPGTRLVGSTTGGEIDAQGMHEGSVVLAGLTGDFDVGIGLGRNLTKDATAAGAAAMLQACNELGVDPADLDGRRYFGITIDDGYRYKKEELLIGALSRNPSLVLVGGGAADSNPDPEKQSAEVHVDGEVATDAVLIAVVRTDARWAAFRSHWYKPTGERLRITKLDSSHKRVLEIDGKPAAQRYADVLGVTVDELEFGKPKGFSKRPTGLKVGKEYFIRSPWKPLPDGSILFANLLEENCDLELMELESLVGPTRRFFEDEMRRKVKNPTGALLFQCGGRVWAAQSAGVTEQLSAEFKNVGTTAGMNVHFEIYCGFHINATLTAVAFGASA